jgi:TATA-box binding protein (TBP) (component of TFIID and TFIIIB)
MPKTEAIVTIQNVVATGTLSQKIDLNAVIKIFQAQNIVQNGSQG